VIRVARFQARNWLTPDSCPPGTAPGVGVGHHHDPVRVENLGRLGHEPDAAEGDHVALEIARLAREFQAVADASASSWISAS
jgi:hypothetical protein